MNIAGNLNSENKLLLIFVRHHSTWGGFWIHRILTLRRAVTFAISTFSISTWLTVIECVVVSLCVIFLYRLNLTGECIPNLYKIYLITQDNTMSMSGEFGNPLRKFKLVFLGEQSGEYFFLLLRLYGLN